MESWNMFGHINTESFQRTVPFWEPQLHVNPVLNAITEVSQIVSVRVATRPGNPGCPGIDLEFFCVLENVLELK